MWQRFDLGEIREDMQRIKALGLDVVRFFLRWDDFQPAPDHMDEAMLRRFESVMDAISDAGLRAMPTLFCGHMSGVNWLPSWSLDPATPHGRFRTVAGEVNSPFGIGDFYHDPLLLRAQELFARAVGERARDHDALYLWDLGNEFSNLRDPARPEHAVDWSTRLTHALKETSNGLVTGGTHGEDLERDRNFRPSEICKPWDVATMHGYSAYAIFARDVYDTDCVPYYATLMQSFSGKPVLFSEFGNPTCMPETAASTLPCLSEDEMPAYGYAVMDKLHARGTLGAYWWCWADYADDIAHLPPFDEALHELSFGIVRKDGSYKPIAGTLAQFASERRTVLSPPAAPIAQEASFYPGLPQTIRALYQEFVR
jgi:endo-1,4-beta-mannosidase